MALEGNAWPSGAHAAFAFTLDNLGEAADIDRGLWPESKPLGSHYSVTDVLPQILELLKKYDIPATYFIESSNLDIYPSAIANLALSGLEVAWHAWRHEAWSKLDEKAERANFERSFGDMSAFVDGRGKGLVKQYRGFRPPGGIIHGNRTLKLCREYGLTYISPSAESGAVVPLDDGKDRIVILPFRWRTVDAYYYMDAFSGLRKMKGELPEPAQGPDTLVERYIEEIDGVIASGGYLSTLFHPFLTNTPERLQALETVLKHLTRRRAEGKLWLAKCEDIADWCLKHPGVVGTDPGWDNTSWR
ncbi:hypothetical protein LTR53_012969 [Teratosphaeriaceae sp. CCFEE 6253]|nr:hypothetical protein LTR53_012969 [Teratosphaeriaceae sp. CCFEE 6253]